MNIVKYKQYLVDECKAICSLLHDDCGTFDELSDLDLKSVDYGYFRPMSISILEMDAGSGASEKDAASEASADIAALDLGDFVVPPNYDNRGEDGCPDQYNFYAKYVQVLLGKLPEWIPARVDISLDSLRFYYLRFDDNEFCEQVGLIEMKYPPHLSLCVEIDNRILHSPSPNPVPDLNPEKYIITVDTKPQGQPDIIISEYVGDALRQTSQICNDDKGTYEFITEA